MLRGIYTSTASMVTNMSAIELLSNNVANTNTVGFKEDFETLVRQAANPLSYGEGGLVRGTGILNLQTGVNLTQGSFHATDGPLDLALQGPGMFAMQSADGTVYGRNGRFHLSSTGQLVTESGNVVLDNQGQPINIPDPQGNPITIREDGTIIIGNATIAQIGVYNSTDWQKAGNWLYTPTGPVTAVTTTPIKQGILELANVDLVHEMGAIMTAERSYEAALQIQHTQDQMLQQSVNDVARLP